MQNTGNYLSLVPLHKKTNALRERCIFLIHTIITKQYSTINLFKTVIKFQGIEALWH